MAKTPRRSTSSPPSPAPPGGPRAAGRPLAGFVAVVAGATRGAGRGIARGLGEAGATVYCTGRSDQGPCRRRTNRPETIDETAELIAQAGGTRHSRPRRSHDRS